MAVKYKFLADLLRKDLVRGRGGRRLPTEQELSQRYHMSRQTVRHALRLLEEEGLIRRRQGSGSFTTGLSGNLPSRQVAMITSFLDDYIFPTILHDAQSVFSRQGYSTLVFATENQVGEERAILQRLLEQPVGGILVEGSKTALPNPNFDLYQQLLQAGTPVVFLHGAYAELSGVPCVADDNFSGGYQLAQHLLHRGHTKIAGIFKSDDIQGLQRYHGCITAIRDAGLPIPDQRFCWYDTQDRLEMVNLRDASLLRRFLENRLGVATGVVCYNDEIAYLLIRELLDLGRRVPEDVAVVSFDNSYYSQISPISITSLRHPSPRMGQVAAEELLRLIQGENPISQSLPWELVERASG